MAEWMTESDIAVLKCFASEVREFEMPAPKKRYMEALENFCRERLSDYFFMRDFMCSEISAAHGIPNIPDNPELAIEAGKGLCQKLLDPLHEIFGHVTIRSAFRSAAVNEFGNKHNLNCASNKKNYAKHIWDIKDNEKFMGATACIVIPRFADYEWYRETGDWRPERWRGSSTIS